MAKQTNSVEDWRILAERDLSVAEYLAVNMYLKGSLIVLEEEPPYIHDLDELCAIAERRRPAFISCFNSRRRIQLPKKLFQLLRSNPRPALGVEFFAVHSECGHEPDAALFVGKVVVLINLFGVFS